MVVIAVLIVAVVVVVIAVVIVAAVVFVIILNEKASLGLNSAEGRRLLLEVLFCTDGAV